ncbi:hypothetical protein WD_0747 [Wolbachia endosymbiont of Drosophila melanogaster]|nr:hypothetical protein WD_0747 [Wolbachia endosymbiont of Drosophila melanogaster]RLT61390.1 hypothetical protein WANA13_1308 [Wolbachia endosymbiont of Drosophila ananassae]
MLTKSVCLLTSKISWIPVSSTGMTPYGHRNDALWLLR